MNIYFTVTFTAPDRVTQSKKSDTIFAPSDIHLEYALANYVMKYGIQNWEKITKKEYESNTQIQKK